MYGFSGQEEVGLVMIFNFVFTEGKFNGSTLTMVGRNLVFSDVREMPLIGGSGAFRFARGYAQVKTVTFDQKTGNSLSDYNLCRDGDVSQTKFFQDFTPTAMEKFHPDSNNTLMSLHNKNELQINSLGTKEALETILKRRYVPLDDLDLQSKKHNPIEIVHIGDFSQIFLYFLGLSSWIVLKINCFFLLDISSSPLMLEAILLQASCMFGEHTQRPFVSGHARIFEEGEWAMTSVMVGAGLAAKHPPFHRSISPTSLGLHKEKLTHLRFYLHDILSGSKPTTVEVKTHSLDTTGNAVLEYNLYVIHY
ncbi:hypothetical protein VNO77_17229 [Canavalia gladiata]|uniref:Dirigent protein n=1 Tax=Canavalia gladiata TaxID=3824 RepID=A0AAN9LNG0_CANGL